MCETYGRDNIDLFSELLVIGKTVEDIERYSECFWKNYRKIDNSRKYIERIEKGEAEIAKRNAIDQAIEDKFQDLAKKCGKDKNFTFQDIEIKYFEK